MQTLPPPPKNKINKIEKKNQRKIWNANSAPLPPPPPQMIQIALT